VTGIPIAVRRADLDDTARLSLVLASAFQYDPVSSWLIPDPVDRARRHPAFFRIFVEHALVWGEGYTTNGTTSRRDDEHHGDHGGGAGLSGAALWLEVDPDQGFQSSSTADALFRAALGPHYERFVLLDKLTQAVHPTGVRHFFLPFIAVLPDEHGQGIGSALLAARHELFDREGVPAYLEASSRTSREFYRHRGYIDHGPPIELPDGPQMWPMWREPRGCGDQGPRDG
jgi:GNAT superfamily N-acetyltransferase